MYVFWGVIAIIMVFGYAYSEWKIMQAIINQVYKKEAIILPGTKKLFKVARFFLAFVGVSAMYFALISFTRTETVFGCWLAPASIIGLLEIFSTSQRIKHLKFKDG